MLPRLFGGESDEGFERFCVRRAYRSPGIYWCAVAGRRSRIVRVCGRHHVDVDGSVA